MTRSVTLLLLAAGAAALGACDSAVAPDPLLDVEGFQRQPSFLLGTGDTARIELPDTVSRNTDVPVVVPTGGGGCVRQGETEATVSGLAADVRPYDYFPAPQSDLVCTADFRVLRHAATVRFSEAGRATVRVYGRVRADGPATVVTRTVVVR